MKARGRPKHTGTLWPSRTKKKPKQNSKEILENNPEKENLPPAKKSCVDRISAKKQCATAGTAAFLVKKRMEQKRKESPSDIIIEIHADMFEGLIHQRLLQHLLNLQ